MFKFIVDTYSVPYFLLLHDRLELSVVLLSIVIGYTNWGITWGFFGHTDHCVGAFGVPFKDDKLSHYLLYFFTAILTFVTQLLHGFDRFVLKYAFEAQTSMCSINLFLESNGTKCLQTPNGKS